MANFPTTAIEQKKRLVEQLKNNSEKWTWAEEPLFLAGIGAPKKLIDNIKSVFYTPSVTRPQYMWYLRDKLIGDKYCNQLRDLLQDLGEVENEGFEEFADVGNEPAGSMVVEGFGEDELCHVETKLKHLCELLAASVDGRVKVSSLTLACMDCFLCSENFDDDWQCLLFKLATLIDAIPLPTRDNFEAAECLVGYQIYVKFISLFAGNLVPLEQIWNEFYKKAKNDVNCKMFINLFQFCMGKTYSEAICETIGSVMSLHRGHGRNLQPVNFSNEIYLRVNLAPLHILKKQFIPEIVDLIVKKEKKVFRRKLDNTADGKRKLVSSATSSTICNFRLKEELASHLPFAFHD